MIDDQETLQIFLEEAREHLNGLSVSYTCQTAARCSGGE